eukprot:CAMPEP_0197728744 /NCGR_PEP_ID=MMETSP1434-20131217/27969_1 /TAXON_ID=265543 /ORGANISM="Minutocellus polymorphus, Strain CCMP3303" /LENGTH=132 /DNA_ID=CAMNT_0043315255 /DNA_START=134 /DNA_END=532 /DNA_ORIENTATION=+
MRNDPLLAVGVSPELGTTQEEETPVDIPLPLLALSVGLREDRSQLARLPILVHDAEPTIAGLLVVGSVDPPMIDAGKVLGKVQKHVVAGHGTAGEEVLREPSLLEVIRVVLVRKDMHKKLAGRFEEAVNLFK